VFADPAILELERGEVFDRSGLYARHGSEVTSRGENEAERQ
jgi:hypothetical protein